MRTHQNTSRILAVRRGHALLVTIMFTMVFLTLGVAVSSIAVTNSRVANKRTVNAQALSLALGGIDEAVFQLKQNKNWGGFATRTLGPGTVTVTVTTPSGLPNRRIVESAGFAANYPTSTLKRVRATFSNGVMPPIFYNAIASKTHLTLNGNITTRSSPLANQGNVHSNGNMTIHGSAVDVYGAATAVGNIAISGGPHIERGATSGVNPMIFPDVDSEYQLKALANGAPIHAGNKAVSDGSLLRGKVSGDLTISGPGGCRIDGVVWVTGDLTITGPVSGKGVLICNGAMSLDARQQYPSADNRNLMFITTSTSQSNGKPAVSLGGNRQFKGIVYAPYGLVKLSGTPDLIGGIMADTITISGNPTVTRWTDFDQDPVEAPSYFIMVAWEEV